MSEQWACLVNLLILSYICFIIIINTYNITHNILKNHTIITKRFIAAFNIHCFVNLTIFNLVNLTHNDHAELIIKYKLLRFDINNIYIKYV